MRKKDLESALNKLLKENEHNLASNNAGYDKGYAEGYHDAIIDVMLQMGIDTDEEWFN